MLRPCRGVQALIRNSEAAGAGAVEVEEERRPRPRQIVLLAVVLGFQGALEGRLGFQVPGSTVAQSTAQIFPATPLLLTMMITIRWEVCVNKFRGERDTM